MSCRLVDCGKLVPVTTMVATIAKMETTLAVHRATDLKSGRPESLSPKKLSQNVSYVTWVSNVLPI